MENQEAYANLLMNSHWLFTSLFGGLCLMTVYLSFLKGAKAALPPPRTAPTPKQEAPTDITTDVREQLVDYLYMQYRQHVVETDRAFMQLFAKLYQERKLNANDLAQLTQDYRQFIPLGLIDQLGLDTYLSLQGEKVGYASYFKLNVATVGKMDMLMPKAEDYAQMASSHLKLSIAEYLNGVLNLALLNRPFPSQVDLTVEWLKPQHGHDYTQHVVLLHFYLNEPRLASRFLHSLDLLKQQGPDPFLYDWAILNYSHNVTLSTGSSHKRTTLTITLSHREYFEDIE